MDYYIVELSRYKQLRCVYALNCLLLWILQSWKSFLPSRLVTKFKSTTSILFRNKICMCFYSIDGSTKSYDTVHNEWLLIQNKISSSHELDAFYCPNSESILALTYIKPAKITRKNSVPYHKKQNTTVHNYNHRKHKYKVRSNFVVTGLCSYHWVLINRYIYSLTCRKVNCDSV